MSWRCPSSFITFITTVSQDGILSRATHVSAGEISDIKLSPTGRLSFSAQSDNHDFNVGLRRKKRLGDAL
jgi:hypothetical protein